MSPRSEGNGDLRDHGDGLDDRVNQFGSELAELSDRELAERATESVEAYYSYLEGQATESLGFTEGWFW
jgi:hypothetical protein